LEIIIGDQRLFPSLFWEISHSDRRRQVSKEQEVPLFNAIDEMFQIM
jgi:hypothetical protein